MTKATKIVVTGGTGSLGRALVASYMDDPSVTRVVVLSRDEVKQGDLAHLYPGDTKLRLFLGDVRDEARLRQAFRGCDTVVHTAALKRITQSVYSPSELIKTNILGTMNTIAAAASVGVRRVLLISSDKAVAATNLYGMTKAVAEGYAIQSNTYTVPQGTCVSVVRYGNVMGSRGSVWEVWTEQKRTGVPLTLTDARMTRFLISLPQAVVLVRECLELMEGGDLFVPILPAAFVSEIAGLLRHPVVTTSIRPGGEKIHETLLSDEERTRLHLISERLFVVIPSHHSWRAEWPRSATTLPPYTSAKVTLQGESLRQWFKDAGLL